MTPLQLSAQFTAYLWFLRQEQNLDKSRADAHAFARQNWEKFLPAADEGFGRLLKKIGKSKKVRTRAGV